MFCHAFRISGEGIVIDVHCILSHFIINHTNANHVVAKHAIDYMDL